MRHWFAALAALFAAPVMAAQPKPLFQSSEPLHLVLQAPLSKLISNRAPQAAIPGTLTDASGQPLPINLTLRGHVNRLAETCEFPPLRVEFTVAPAATAGI